MRALLGLLALTLTACGGASKPNLLVIGDSISIGYTPTLKSELTNYNVRRVGNTAGDPDRAVNAMNTHNTLQNLDGWLSYYQMNSVITWNNGLWNADERANDGIHQTSLDQYRDEITQIATKLKATGARVIFITTTPIVSGSPYTMGKETQENDIARQVLIPMGIEIIDTNTLAAAHPEWHISPTDVHYTAEGYNQMGKLIAGKI